MAVSLSVAIHQASLPVAYRLYLPKDGPRTRSGAPRPACLPVRIPLKDPPIPRAARNQAEAEARALSALQVHLRGAFLRMEAAE